MAENIRHLGTPVGRAGEFERVHSIKRALTASDAAAGVLSLKNATGRPLYVRALVLRITTKATGACTLDAGIAATEALDDDLIDGLDVGTAAGIFDNVQDSGINGGKRGRLWDKDEFLTISKATGATAGLVGQAIIHCEPIE